MDGWNSKGAWITATQTVFTYTCFRSLTETLFLKFRSSSEARFKVEHGILSLYVFKGSTLGASSVANHYFKCSHLFSDL